MVDKERDITVTEASRGFWLTTSLGLPLLNTGLIYGVGSQWDPHRLAVPLLCALLALELSGLWEWLRHRGTQGRGWRIFLAGVTIAANTFVLVFVALYAFLATCDCLS